MSSDSIDSEGYRANVGIILCHADGRLLLAGRVGSKGWQFPQGGLIEGESAEEAMYRELKEEVGLDAVDVEVLGSTEEWLKYRLPDKYMRHGSLPLCIGQKQRWFMLRLIGSEGNVQLDASETPEFDRWRWVEFWRPVNEVIYFKRRVYVRALHELGRHVHPQGLPPWPRWWPSRWRAAFDKDLAKSNKARIDDA